MSRQSISSSGKLRGIRDQAVSWDLQTLLRDPKPVHTGTKARERVWSPTEGHAIQTSSRKRQNGETLRPPPSRWKEVLRTMRNYRSEFFPTHLCLWAITPAPTECQSLLLREQPVNKEKTKLRLLPRSLHSTLLLNSCHSNNAPRKEIKSHLRNFQLPSKEIRNEIQLLPLKFVF